MRRIDMGATSLAIIHYPVLDKRGDIVSTSITNLEMHDVARSCMTFGVELCYIVTPLERQRAIAEQLIDHWRSGYGRQYNPDRAEALEKISIRKACRRSDGRIRRTSASCHRDVFEGKGRLDRIQGAEEVDRHPDPRPFLLLFGTGWGLAARNSGRLRKNVVADQGKG